MGSPCLGLFMSLQTLWTSSCPLSWVKHRLPQEQTKAVTLGQSLQCPSMHCQGHGSLRGLPEI